MNNTHQQRKITVTYFDSTTRKAQTETFGMLHCAEAFARALMVSDKYRILQIWDVYGNRPIDVTEAQPELREAA